MTQLYFRASLQLNDFGFSHLSLYIRPSLSACLNRHAFFIHKTTPSPPAERGKKPIPERKKSGIKTRYFYQMGKRMIRDRERQRKKWDVSLSMGCSQLAWSERALSACTTELTN